MDVLTTLRSIRALECEYIRLLAELARDDKTALAAYTGLSFDTCKKLSEFSERHALHLERAFQANTSSLFTISSKYPWTPAKNTSRIEHAALASIRKVERKIALVIRDVVFLDADAAVICCGLDVRSLKAVKEQVCSDYQDCMFDASNAESLLALRMREADLGRVIAKCSEPIFEQMGLTLNKVVRHADIYI